MSTTPCKLLKEYKKHLATALEYAALDSHSKPISAFPDRNPKQDLFVFPICKVGKKLKPPRLNRKGTIVPVTSNDLTACRPLICKAEGRNAKVRGAVYVTGRHERAKMKVPIFVAAQVLNNALKAQKGQYDFDCFVNRHGMGYCVSYSSNLPKKTLSALQKMNNIDRDLDLQIEKSKRTSDRRQDIVLKIDAMIDKQLTTKDHLERLALIKRVDGLNIELADIDDEIGDNWHNLKQLKEDYDKAVKSFVGTKAGIGNLGQVCKFDVFTRTEKWPNGFPGRKIKPSPVITPGFYRKGISQYAHKRNPVKVRY